MLTLSQHVPCCMHVDVWPDLPQLAMGFPFQPLQSQGYTLIPAMQVVHFIEEDFTHLRSATRSAIC